VVVPNPGLIAQLESFISKPYAFMKRIILLLFEFSFQSKQQQSNSSLKLRSKSSSSSALSTKDLYEISVNEFQAFHSLQKDSHHQQQQQQPQPSDSQYLEEIDAFTSSVSLISSFLPSSSARVAILKLFSECNIDHSIYLSALAILDTSTSNNLSPLQKQKLHIVKFLQIYLSELFQTSVYYSSLQNKDLLLGDHFYNPFLVLGADSLYSLPNHGSLSFSVSIPWYLTNIATNQFLLNSFSSFIKSFLQFYENNYLSIQNPLGNNQTTSYLTDVTSSHLFSSQMSSSGLNRNSHLQGQQTNSSSNNNNKSSEHNKFKYFLEFLHYIFENNHLNHENYLFLTYKEAETILDILQEYSLNRYYSRMNYIEKLLFQLYSFQDCKLFLIRNLYFNQVRTFSSKISGSFPSFYVFS
jgi:hypothetical protein